MTAERRQRPLSGLRVLDFSQVYAGPICAGMLGALGADVIKVESHQRLDTTRRSLLLYPGPPISDVDGARKYQLFNHNKRSVLLNLQHDEGRAIAARLAAQCEVVIAAYRPGVLERMGLHYERLRELRRDLLMVSISGNGQDGPEARYATYAAIFAALAGMSHLTSYRDGIPAEYRGSVDMRVGFFAFLATLAGLRHRARTGEGGHIDLSGRECMSAFIGDAFLTSQGSGTQPAPVGNEDECMSPHNCFLTEDGKTWVALAVGSEEEWRAFCAVSGIPGLAEDARFADGFRRWKHREALEQIVSGWMATQDAATVITQLQERGVAATYSYRMDHALHDPHLQERGAFGRHDVPPAGPTTFVESPWRIEGRADAYRIERAPRLGEHSESVLREIAGLSQAEYEQAVANGAIG